MSSIPLGSRLIAPGCRVRTAAGGDRIEVEARFPFSGWSPRQAAGRTIAGTPVLIGERWYEVISTSADEGRWSYLLGPWPTDESIRAPSELTAESAAQAGRAFESARRREEAAWALALAMPVVGALPAPDQQRIESEFGISAARATMVSAVLGLGLGFAGTLLVLMQSRGWDLGLLSDSFLLDLPCSLVWLWLIPESVVRLGSGQPCGSLVLALPLGALGVLRQAFLATRARARRPPLAQAQPRLADRLRHFAADDPSAPRDRDGEPIAVEIATEVERGDWVVGSTGVAIDGRVHRLVERVEERDGRRLTYRFRFAAPGDADTFRGVLEWHPGQALELAVAAKRRERGLWVEPLSPLWGLLDEGLQAELAKAYEYQPRRGVIASIVVTAVIGVVSLLQAQSHAMAGQSAADDIPLLLLGGWCILEAILRTWRRSEDVAVPSAFAPLVAPLARRALR